MTVTIRTREQAATRWAECRDELAAISQQMTTIGAVVGENVSPTIIAEVDELTQQADLLIAEQSELRKRFPQMWRATQPSQPGPRFNKMTATTQDGTSDYAKLHGLQKTRLDDGGFKSFGEFLSVLGGGMHDERIMELRASASSSLFSAGGVMVPEMFVAEMLHPPGEAELIMPRARVYPMTAGTLRVATLDNLSNADGEMFGGFSAQWVAEGTDFTEQTPQTSSCAFSRKKLGIFTMASTELVSDSDYERELVPAIQAAIQEFRDYAFIAGDGLGKPRGILNDPAIITIAKESGQVADTLQVANLDNMYSRIHPRLIRNARWYVNPTTIPELFKLVRNVGTGGASIPVLNETSGAFSMYGLPVELTSKLPVLGETGDVVLADVSQYGIGASRGVALYRSEHYAFKSGKVAWRAEWRGDGMGLWRAPFTPRNGSTLSWCAKLAERA